MNEDEDLEVELVDDADEAALETVADEQPAVKPPTGADALFRRRLKERKLAASEKVGARIAFTLAGLVKRECGHSLYGALVTDEHQLALAPSDTLTSFIVETVKGERALVVNISQSAARRFVSALLGGTDDDRTALRPQGGIVFSQTDKIGTRRLAELAVAALNQVAPGSADQFRLKDISKDDEGGWTLTPDDLVIDFRNEDFRTEYCEMSLTIAGRALTLFGEKGPKRQNLPEQVAARRMEMFAGMIPVRVACRVAEGELTLDDLDRIRPGDTFAVERLPLAVLTVGEATVGNAVTGSQDNRRAICIQGCD